MGFGNSHRPELIAGGTPITGRPPHNAVRAAFPIRRPPWVRDTEAVIGPRMEDSRLWKEIIGKHRNPFPIRLILLTATP